jgi:hypothetical protein
VEVKEQNQVKISHKCTALKNGMMMMMMWTFNKSRESITENKGASIKDSLCGYELKQHKS